jgi:hypothetical protein
LRTRTVCHNKEFVMSTIPENSITQSDDVAGHATLNVNETVDSDDDTEGHATLNVNETVDSDDDQ